MLRQMMATGLMTVALAGCGNGDDDRDFADVERETLDMLGDVSSLGISPALFLPTSGTASYDGYLGAADTSGAIIGDLDLTADFGADSISGTASNFIDEENTEYTGRLTISNGDIFRTADPATEYQIAADVNGTLSTDEARTSVNAIMLGDFFGGSQQGVAGILRGTTTDQFGTTLLDGSNSGFVAERR